MTKIIVTESQFNKLIDSSSKEEVLEEGFKEILLGAAMLMGLNMNAQNQEIAQDALNKEQVVQQIQNTIENDSTRNKMVSAMENAGVQNAEEKLMDVNKKLLKKLKKKGYEAGEVQDFKGTQAQLDTKLRSGEYAILDVTEFKQMVETVDYIDTVITIDIISDNNFVTGGFSLEGELSSQIANTLKDINETYDDVEITIESSTDTEPIRKYVSEKDPTGNKTLSYNRAKSIASIATQSGIDSSAIKINTLNDQGPDAYSTDMSREERLNARKATAEYRYVKVTIKAKVKVDKPQVSTEEKTETYCKVVQIRKKTNGIKLDKGGGVDNKSFSFPVGGGDKTPVLDQCPVF